MISSTKKDNNFTTPIGKTQFSNFSDNTKALEKNFNNNNGSYGYTPESHSSKPRSIQSTELR